MHFKLCGAFCVIASPIKVSLLFWQLSVQKWYVSIPKSVTFEKKSDEFGVFGKAVGVDKDY